MKNFLKKTFNVLRRLFGSAKKASLSKKQQSELFKNGFGFGVSGGDFNHLIDHWFCKCKLWLFTTTKGYKTHQAVLQNQIGQIEELLSLSEEDWSRRGRGQLAKRKVSGKKAVREAVNGYETELEHNIRRQGEFTSKLAQREVEGKSNPMVKTLFDTTIGMMCMALAIMGLETVFTTPGLSGSLVPDVLVWPIAILLSALIAVSAHYAGEQIAARRSKYAIAWFGLGLGVIGLIVAIRGIDGHHITLCLLNVAIYIAAILMTIYRSERHLGFVLRSALAKTEARQQELETALLNVNDRLADVESLTEADISEYVEQEQERLTNEHNRLSTELVTVSGQIAEANQEAQARQDLGKAILMVAYAKGIAARPIRTWSKVSKAVVVALPMSLSLFSIGCSNSESPSRLNTEDSIELVYILDRSGSMRDDLQLISGEAGNGLVGELDFSATEPFYGSVNISLVVMDYQSTPQVAVLSMPSVSLMERVKNTRLTEMAALGNKLRARVDSLYSLPISNGHTNVYRTLAYMLNQLVESSASKRVLIWHSDGLESNSSVGSLEDYLNDLDGLKRDREQLMGKMLAAHPLEDLNGISIYQVFKTSSYDDEIIFTVANDYWKPLFESKGAEFKFQSSFSK